MVNYKYEKLDFSDIFSKKYREFTPILNEYFSRMKADLDLTEEQVLKKVQLFYKNVRKIKFGLLPLKYKGSFIPEKSTILFNVDLFNNEQDYEHLFSIITHELDHACNYDKKGKKFGMYRYDDKLKNVFNPQDVLLDEIRTDIGATRRVFNDNYIDYNKMIRKTSGYKNYSTFSTMLQNCLGITEKEFLDISENGREYFDEKMKSRFIDANDYFKFMEQFTLNTAILLNKERLEEKQTLIDSQDFSNAFQNLKALSYTGLNLRLEKDIISNPNINLEEYLKNIRYSMQENEKNFEFASNEFSINSKVREIMNLVGQGRYDELLNFVETKKQDQISKGQDMLQCKIIYLEMILSNKDVIGEKFQTAIQKINAVAEVSELKEYAKNEFNLELEYNKELKFDKELDVNTIEKRKLQKQNSYNWDNSEILVDIQGFFIKNKSKKKNKILAKIIKNLHPSELEELNQPKDDGIYNANEVGKLKDDIRSSTMTLKEVVEIDKERLESESIQNNKSKDINTKYITK